MAHDSLLRRFVDFQQRHAWRELEAVERIWATSDLHAEHDANLAFINSLDGYERDALVVAGDVCTSLALLRRVMPVLVAKFRHVFYVAGNHELWHDAATDGVDSFEKLLTIYELVTALGAHAAPAVLGSKVVVMPLQSWYHTGFTRGTVVDMPRGHPLSMMDGGCRWPSCLGGSSVSSKLARFFAKCNEEAIAQAASWTSWCSCVSFSHFLPHAELHRTHPSALRDGLADVEGSCRRALSQLSTQLDSVAYVMLRAVGDSTCSTAFSEAAGEASAADGLAGGWRRRDGGGPASAAAVVTDGSRSARRRRLDLNIRTRLRLDLNIRCWASSWRCEFGGENAGQCESLFAWVLGAHGPAVANGPSRAPGTSSRSSRLPARRRWSWSG